MHMFIYPSINPNKKRKKYQINIGNDSMSIINFILYIARDPIITSIIAILGPLKSAHTISKV